MRILMLTPYLPYPPSSGGQVRSFNLIKYLSKKHDITLFSLIKSDREKKYLKKLRKYCRQIKVFKRSSTPWTPRNIFLAVFSFYPFLVIRNLVPSLKKDLELELEKERYDLIHAETFYVTPHVPEGKIPLLLVEQTIEFLVYKHHVETQNFFLFKPLFFLDVLKIRYWESFFWKKAKKVVAVSEADKKIMQSIIPDLKVDIVPNGVDLSFFKVREKFGSKEPKLLFVANFKWLQNIEAASILIREVFPLIRERIKDAKLWIVGQFVPKNILFYAQRDKNILITNISVEDQETIKNAYYKSDVFVSPLKGPGGTRLKHFAAMASKLPLVTTSVGAEGIDAKDGKHLIIRDDPGEMAEAVVDLLLHPEKGKRIADNARLLVEKRYSWEKIAELLDKIYTRVVNE